MEVELKMTFPDPTCFNAFITDRWKDQIMPAEKTRKIMMHSYYYDTLARDLDQIRSTVRLRLENQSAVLTLKQGDQNDRGVFRRQEWSVSISPEKLSEYQPVDTLDSQLVRGLFESESWFAAHSGHQADPLIDLLDKIEGQSLFAIAEIRFSRLAALVEIDGSQLETALDQGCFIAGKQTKEFKELEIELLSGDSALLNVLSQKLADQYGLIPETESKLARCLVFARSCEPEFYCDER